MSCTNSEKTAGFTLTELLVVMGIMAILMGLIVPATRSLTRANPLQECSIKLQQIGTALKAYHLDYKSVPPMYIFETGPGWDDIDIDLGTLDPEDEIKDMNTEPANNGLHILFETEYLHSRRALHCPNYKDRDHPEYSDPNEAEYYASYAGLDENAKVELQTEGYDHDYWINSYKYMPCRTWQLWDVAGDRNPRQLAPSVEPVWIYDEASAQDRWAWTPVAGVSWYPDDTTVVTWCNLHTKEFKRQVQGEETTKVEEMYQVLFWDGSVKVIPARLLTDKEDANSDPLPPDAAWKVHPDDSLPD